jgi:hypothetical protein
MTATAMSSTNLVQNTVTEKQTSRYAGIGKGTPGPGRKKGVPNKVAMGLKEAIIKAGTRAGGEEGLVGYLTDLAKTNSSAYASLLAKVIPTVLEGSGSGGGVSVIINRIERVVVDTREDAGMVVVSGVDLSPVALE